MKYRTFGKTRAGKLARPSRPLRGPRLALHSQPAAATRRTPRKIPPRPLTGRLLIGLLLSKICIRTDQRISEIYLLAE